MLFVMIFAGQSLLIKYNSFQLIKISFTKTTFLELFCCYSDTITCGLLMLCCNCNPLCPLAFPVMTQNPRQVCACSLISHRMAWIEIDFLFDFLLFITVIMSLCAIHCVHEAASSSQQLSILTEKRLDTLKQRIAFILQHKDDTHQTIFEIASANKNLLNIQFNSASPIYYHMSCYTKLTHNRYILKRNSTQTVESLHDQVSLLQARTILILYSCPTHRWEDVTFLVL